MSVLSTISPERSDPPGRRDPALLDARCALCRGRDRRPRFEDDPWSVVECRACGLTYVTPQLAPAALVERVYDEGYWASATPRIRGYGDYRAQAELHARTFTRRLRELERHVPARGRALDVGCADGTFLSLLAQRGFDVLGLEPSASIRTDATRRLGSERVLAATLADAELPRAAFDLVTLWDVVEHLSDPLSDLRRLRSALAPSGRLVLETQDVQSLAARLLGRRWHHFKHAEHLHHFHAGTLECLLERSGFELVHRTRRGAGKYVTPAFIAERSRRVAPVVAPLVRQLVRCLPRAMYVNPHDEWIVVARARA